MARTAKKQAPAKIEEDDDTEGWEDAVVETDAKDGRADLRLRDWRDVERFREMKDLRRLVDDDYGLEEIFHVHLKPRVEVPPRQPRVVPAKGGNAKLMPAPKLAAKAAQPAAAKAAPAPKPASKKAAQAKAKPTAKAKKKK